MLAFEETCPAKQKWVLKSKTSEADVLAMAEIHLVDREIAANHPAAAEKAMQTETK